MNVLVTGNLGYIGPVVGKHLSKTMGTAGYDTAFFSTCLTDRSYPADRYYKKQIFGDIRQIEKAHLENIDAIVHLSAISNDPMGKMFEELTMDVNHKASVRLAELAKSAGVKKFTFASSCSVYGIAEGGDKTENSQLHPLTAYARSKAQTETDLKSLSNDQFSVSCLRFATACGWSPRLRLDLVLNDFVAGALSTGQIKILSDGTPWRPLIDVNDMARAIEWSLTREKWHADSYVVVNVGSQRWNYQVKDLALAVQKALGSSVKVETNPEATVDKRSYKVDFSFFEKIAPQHQPQKELSMTVNDLVDGLRKMGFQDPNYHHSFMIRLKEILRLKESRALNENLFWS